MELDRIVEKSAADAAVETWLELCDKIIALADQEVENQTVKRLRQLAPADNLSEGGLKITACLCTDLAIKGIHVLSTDAKSLHALCLLYYLMPDTRTKPDHNRIFKFFPVSSY